jgi:hypothetical protein
VSSNHSTKIGIRELGALTMWVRSVVGRHFNVSFVKGLEAPCIDAKGNMRLPLPNSSMTISDAIKLRGWCIHETSHPMYQPDGFEILKNNPMKADSKLGFIFNMVMDVHCETMRYLDWPGDGKALSEYGAVLGHDISPKVASILKAGDVDEDYLKTLALLYACIRAEATWNVGLAISFDTLFTRDYPKDIVTLGDTLISKFRLRERLVENPQDETSQSMFDLSKEIYEFLYDKDPEGEIQKKGKGTPGEGESEEEGDGEGEGESTASESDKEGEGKPTKGKLKQRPKITDLLRSDHYETLVGNGHGMGFDFTKYKSSEVYTPIDFSRFKFVNYKKGES